MEFIPFNYIIGGIYFQYIFLGKIFPPVDSCDKLEIKLVVLQKLKNDSFIRGL
jgi:hypothetical protein